MTHMCHLGFYFLNCLFNTQKLVSMCLLILKQQCITFEKVVTSVDRIRVFYN
jgi:hypothetical protein